ncbi:zinc finger protein [Apiospora arundinis]|uniref:Zinc finger protein n=1 Tax=Apiospora arundinis TaxID=335852 RepID=A0ABR2ITN9_9PEZI
MDSKKASGAGPSTATDTLFLDSDNLPDMGTLPDEAGPWPARRRASSSSSTESRSKTSESCMYARNLYLLPTSIIRRVLTAPSARQTSGEDCARQRFIVWAAVKRNKSVRMAHSERLRCPLLRCGEQFENHEDMLEHLTDCRHFATGEYVCYDCMKVERYSEEGKCKGCLGGHPTTKRRRIIQKAKNFFSTLGHRSRKDGMIDVVPDDVLPSPPSYDSLDIPQEPAAPEAQSTLEIEMGGTEILEMDSSSQPLQLDPVNYETQPSMSNGPFPANNINSMVAPAVGLVDLGSSSASCRPSLALDTRNVGRRQAKRSGAFLTPSSSLRSANSSISPMSAGSLAWTLDSSINTNLTSPITPFSPDEVESSTLSRENSCKFPKDHPTVVCWDGELGDGVSDKTVLLQDPLEARINNGDYALSSISELPGDDPLSLSVPRAWNNEPLFDFDQEQNFSWSSSVDTEINVLFTSTDQSREAPPTQINQEQESTSGSDTQVLVHTAWETLREHVTTSVTKVSLGLGGNALAQELKPLSAKEVALKGLAVLRSILGGSDPEQPLDYICFVHLAYALSWVVHEDDLSDRCKHLFQQAIAYQGFLSADQRGSFCQLVRAIWQPRDTTQSTQQASSTVLTSDHKGKAPEYRYNTSTPIGADPLIGVAQSFLDDLEALIITNALETPGCIGSIEVLTSDLWSMHLSENSQNSKPPDAFVITVDYITHFLSQKFGSPNEALASKLRALYTKVESGYISTIRRLELEILQAGKSILPTPQSFDAYTREVRTLCDPIYTQQGLNPRSRYHMLGVDLVESLIRAVPDGSLREDVGSFSGPDVFDEFLHNFDEVFVGGESDFLMPTSISPLNVEGPAITHASKVPTEASAFPTVNPTILGRNSPSATNKIPSCQDPGPISPMVRNVHSVVEAGGVNSPGEEEGGTSAAQQQQKVEANSCCEICGYRPKGDPQWFKGSMAKHKKLQHSTDPPRIYKCSYPGCTSAYKNRPDNLRQHQIEKGHFVEGVDSTGRPAKRKKTSPE